MRTVLFFASLAMVGVALTPPASAETYTVKDLLSPCQEADNDARWGETAELECEQYILGFVDALKHVGAKTDLGICAPEQNTADEVRWAFMRWVHESYSKRTKMPASEAMMATLQENFACK